MAAQNQQQQQQKQTIRKCKVSWLLRSYLLSAAINRFAYGLNFATIR